jgi:hypothetical protein
MLPYRVFISYSHGDRALVESLAPILQANGLHPMWDRHFHFGQGFHEQIRNFIAHAHVFMPVITANSSQRGWVHQEIGYAMALNIPVLPLAVGTMPGQMIEQLLAVPVVGDDLSQLSEHLAPHVFEQLVAESSKPSLALYQCAAVQEERSILMARHARDVQKLGEVAHVRQRQGLSTFDIPDRPVDHALWSERYGKLPRSTYQCELLREERRALGEHARAAGCSLILDLSRSFEAYGPAVRLSRLRCLRSFLEALPDDKARIAITNLKSGSLLILGDWFVAESVSGAQGSGYRQTIFTRHAPAVRQRMEQFDEEIEARLADSGTPALQSRRVAIEQIDRVLADLAH